MNPPDRPKGELPLGETAPDAQGAMDARPVLWFMHGWAFDRSLWDALREQLADWPHAVADAGYFGEPAWPATAGPVVAIGHSQGFMQLLRHLPPSCAGLVAINGFSRFTAAPDHPAGVASRVLDRMLTRLDTQAATVIDDFRERCGGTPAERAPDVPRLRDALQALRDDDCRETLAGCGLPVLALAGDADVVVPPALSSACFAPCPDARLEWSGGGHLLPISAPAWCAGHIRGYLDALAVRGGSQA